MARSDHVLFLAENLFNPIQYPNHVITNEDLFPDLFRIGSSRRSDQNAVSPLNPTNLLVLEIKTDRQRAVDTLIVDRNSEVAGRRLQLTVSSDLDSVFAVEEQVMPAANAVVEGSSIDDPSHPIVTEEGAYIFHFPLVSGSRFSLTLFNDVVSAGKLGGCYLGRSFRPTYPRLPFDGLGRYMEHPTIRRGVPGNDIRTGHNASVSMMMRDEQEWDQARWTLRQLYGRGHPMWFVPNANRAERSWLAYNASGNVAAPFSERPQGRSVQIELDEYDPALP